VLRHRQRRRRGGEPRDLRAARGDDEFVKVPHHAARFRFHFQEIENGTRATSVHLALAHHHAVEAFSFREFRDLRVAFGFLTAELVTRERHDHETVAELFLQQSELVVVTPRRSSVRSHVAHHHDLALVLREVVGLLVHVELGVELVEATPRGPWGEGEQGGEDAGHHGGGRDGPERTRKKDDGSGEGVAPGLRAGRRERLGGATER